MTAPKMVLCRMCGELVRGPVAPDRTAYCPDPKCLSTLAPTRKIKRADGKMKIVYADHYHRAHPRRGKRRAAPKSLRSESRDSHRRR